MKYGILTDDRKEIVRKLEELTGQRPRYTGMPAAAYELDGIVIGNNGTVTADENADMSLISRLIETGLIRREQEMQDGGSNYTEHSNDPTEDDAESMEENPVETGEESNEPEGEASGTDEESDELDGEFTEAGEEITGMDGEPTETDEGNADPNAIKPEVSFPLEKHRLESIINLVFAIYSKGSLISKSTGGAFTATKELVEKLQASDFGSKEDVIKAVQEDGGLSGISFDEEKVTFDGFIPTADPDEVKAWTALAAAINRNAIEQKHVRAKEADETNEKYAFRTWLTRIGLKGKDTKAERKLLYRNLSGHTAFRTEEDREKWNAMMKAKKEKQKAETPDADMESAQGAEADGADSAFEPEEQP